MGDRLKEFLHSLSLRTMWEEQEEDDWEDFDTRDDYMSGADSAEAAQARKIRPGYAVLIILALITAALVIYQEASRHHTYTSLSVTESYEIANDSGASYAKLGNDFVRYGADGVTLSDAGNSTIWNSAYTMQAPEADICGQDMVIYEQQGSQVTVLDQSGVIGQFETNFPILKGAVAGNGVTAFILKNDGEALVRLYAPDGSVLAEVRATLEDTGYPIALDLSSDAVQLMVSTARIGSGSVDSSILFYDFSSATESASDHITGQAERTDVLYPEVFFATDSIPVAAGDTGALIFKSGGKGEVRCEVPFDSEVLSVFHDEEHFGVVRQSDDTENRYEIDVYNYRGKQTMSHLFNSGYSTVRMDEGEILMNSSGHVCAFTPDGTLRLDSDYDRNIAAFVKIPGFRRYCVFTGSSMDRVRAE